MKKTVFFVLCAITFLSCNQNTVYETHESNFPDYRWAKEKTINFNPIIEDDTTACDVYLALRHVAGFQHPAMKVSVERTAPSGETSKKDYSMKVIGDDGQYISDCAGDYCDLEVLIEDDVIFKEKGQYKYVVSQTMDGEYVPNVMEFGLIIKKNENKENN